MDDLRAVKEKMTEDLPRRERGGMKETEQRRERPLEPMKDFLRPY